MQAHEYVLVTIAQSNCKICMKLADLNGFLVGFVLCCVL